MKRTLIFMTVTLAFAFLFQNAIAQESIDGRYNIAELMDSARANFDLEQQDGVFLLDSKDVKWLEDGRLSTTVHRIIWIATDFAVDQYGDHRIPYDHERQDFEVITVRTWMDNQWWVTGETGIVPTLPHALKKAYDYTNMREMMLLHNGIEIPCILEVAYTITDKEPYRKNIDGMWVFQKELPVVVSSISMRTPEIRSPKFYRPLSLPSPNIEENGGLKTYSHTSGPYEAIPDPWSQHDIFSAPHIVWSTWDSWNSLGEYYDSLFQQVMSIDDYLQTTVDSLADASINRQKCAVEIASFVSKKTGFISYPYRYWMYFPRETVRIYESAYGHALDRALLASALFELADLEPKMILRGENLQDAYLEIPCFDYFDAPLIKIAADGSEMYYNPVNGMISKSIQPYFGQTGFYLTDNRGRPIQKFEFPEEENLFTLKVDLSLNDTKDTLNGIAYLEAEGCFSPYSQMAGLDKEAESYLGSMISGVISGAKLKSHNPIHFREGRCRMGMNFELKTPKPDEFGHIRLVFGSPSGGIVDQLPEGVRLFDNVKQSKTNLPGTLIQTVEISIDTSGMQAVYFPESESIQNEVGSISIISENAKDRIRIIRRMHLTNNEVASSQWPDLRELLLEETDRRNQMFIFEAGEESDKKGD